MRRCKVAQRHLAGLEVLHDEAGANGAGQTAVGGGFDVSAWVVGQQGVLQAFVFTGLFGDVLNELHAPVPELVGVNQGLEFVLSEVQGWFEVGNDAEQWVGKGAVIEYAVDDLVGGVLRRSAEVGFVIADVQGAQTFSADLVLSDALAAGEHPAERLAGHFLFCVGVFGGARTASIEHGLVLRDEDQPV